MHTDSTPITCILTREELDAILYAIARRRERIREYLAICDASSQPSTAKHYQEEDQMLARINVKIARTIGLDALAHINARNSAALQREDIPAWMQGLPIELD